MAQQCDDALPQRNAKPCWVGVCRVLRSWGPLKSVPHLQEAVDNLLAECSGEEDEPTDSSSSPFTNRNEALGATSVQPISVEPKQVIGVQQIDAAPAPAPAPALKPQAAEKVDAKAKTTPKSDLKRTSESGTKPPEAKSKPKLATKKKPNVDYSKFDRIVEAEERMSRGKTYSVYGREGVNQVVNGVYAEDGTLNGKPKYTKINLLPGEPPRWVKVNDKGQWMFSRHPDGRALGEGFNEDKEARNIEEIRGMWFMNSERGFEEDPNIMIASGECASCGSALVRPLRCAVCKAVSYCSQSCQRRDWQFHKRICQKYEISEAILQEERKEQRKEAEKEAKAKDAKAKKVTSHNKGGVEIEELESTGADEANEEEEDEHPYVKEMTRFNEERDKRRKELDEDMAKDDEEILKEIGWKSTKEIRAEHAERLEKEEKDGKAKRIDPAPQPIAIPTVTEGKEYTSPWNAAGTWEEKNMMAWAENHLIELLAGGKLLVPCGMGHLEVTDCRDIDGFASIGNCRGERKFLFDLSFSLIFIATWVGDLSTFTMEGKVKIADLNSELLTDEDMICGMDVEFAQGAEDPRDQQRITTTTCINNEQRSEIVEAVGTTGKDIREGRGLMFLVHRRLRQFREDFMKQ